jgi:hypothetical protein
MTIVEFVGIGTAGNQPFGSTGIGIQGFTFAR